MVKDAFAKRKLLLTGDSDRTKKRIMKIFGVECAVAHGVKIRTYTF